jgi:MscS family membrane protein
MIQECLNGINAAAGSEGGLSLVLGSFVILVGFWLLSLLVAYFLTSWFRKLAKRLAPDMDSNSLNAFLKPIKLLLLTTGFYLALVYLPLPAVIDSFAHRLYRSVVVLFLVWGIYNLLDNHSLLSDEARQRYHLDNTLVILFSRLARFIVVVLGLLVAIREWGYDLNGFIAGLGLGGLAISLAAKDALANIVGGVVLFMEKPFSVGEWITTPDSEGTVEEISFRSTRIKTFSQALVTIPNSMLSNAPITNHSRLGRLRIDLQIGVTYNTPQEQLIKMIEGIKELLQRHPDVIDEYTHVNLRQFGASSIDVEVTFVTPLGEGRSFRAVRNDIHLKLMELLRDLEISLAFPTQTLYLHGADKYGLTDNYDQQSRPIP